MRSAKRAAWLNAARSVYLVALVAGFGWALWANRGEVEAMTSDVRPVFLAAAFVVTALQIPAAAGMWTVALRGMGENVRLGWVVEAAARALPARYIPGSIWFALGRIALLRARGARASTVTAVAVLEGGLGFVVAAGLGVGVLVAAGELPGGTAALVPWALGTIALASPPVVNVGLAWIARKRGLAPARLGWATYALVVGLMAAFWALSAAAFVLYVTAFPDLSDASHLATAGAFMVARAAGFLAVFAPQGIGVFEVAVAAVVAAPDDLAGAAIVVAGYRVVLLVRDAAASILGEVAARRRLGRSAGADPVG